MRIDERDTILSRIRYQKGDGMYEDYYQNKSDKLEIDDQLRAMPGINAPGTPMYQAIHSIFPDSAFDFLSDIKQFSRRGAKTPPQDIAPGAMSEQLKKLALYLGATDVGIVKLDEDSFYSHRGRTVDQYGKNIEGEGPFGIVMTKEMPREMINRAPHLEEMTAVTKAYMDLAIIGMWLTYYISNLGYDAKNNMDMDYLLFVPKAAEMAGLGTIGRAGILVTETYGMRVRIGVVTTNMTLIADEAKEDGIRALCQICGLCAKHCPSGAITKEAPKMIDGIPRYVSDQERCFKMWKTLGTDCGICLSTCPLSQELPADLRKNLKNDPSTILEWHAKHIGKRIYTKTPLALFNE